MLIDCARLDAASVSETSRTTDTLWEPPDDRGCYSILQVRLANS
jgi:hypothetical protein